jgi:glycosyltransferase involved in cell wall biosynthesis
VRIALVAPVWFPVPPRGYGGTELVVSLLADGLVARGHDVTLFASGDSATRARLASVHPAAMGDRIGQAAPELDHVLSCLERAGEFDVVNDHTVLVGSSLAGLVETPVVNTIHYPLTGATRAILTRVARIVPHLGLMSLSLSQRRGAPQLPWIANCPNGIDLGAYPPKGSRGGDYLLFLGRISPSKGPQHAVAVARELGMPLVIAAKAREPSERSFFEEAIRPALGNGIEYVGEVGHEEKVRLLRGAEATLFPIEWEEPAALVPLESMACGTPVVATSRGSVPEIVRDGVTGIVVERPEALPAAVEAASRIEPGACRAHVVESFSAERMVERYEAVYERIAG